ncbi:MAG: tRNA (adenosine(37)-N6)-dimethylallyltransferase MiaA [Bacteroidia bacterium]|nr:tRNA (adenosine(37)-N6)-dimethylallyltransferase MiaA [Bacteroidia bacterium]
MKRDPFLLVISGPTGAGKTELAIDLYIRYGWPIISADSRQVYRYLDIGTNKIPQSLQAEVPHFLIDVCSPNESYSAGRFVEEVERLLCCWKVPVVQVVGGTGFYIHALLHGLASIPPIPNEIRHRAQAWLDQAGLSAVVQWLREKDPLTAAHIDLHNPRRVLRAVEVLQATGKPWVSFWSQQPPRHHGLKVVLSLPRSALYKAIAQRTQAQVAAGWLEETLFVLEKGYPPTAPAFQTLGYKECLEVLQGKRQSSTLLDSITTANRQYARRQLTWWRRRAPHLWIEEASLSHRRQKVIEELLRLMNQLSPSQ